MKVEIRLVKKCKGGAFGGLYVRGHNSILITVSLEKNNTMAEYAATLLHELLHLWITILQRKKFKCSNTKEHSFIYAVEKIVYKMAERFLKRRKRK